MEPTKLPNHIAPVPRTTAVEPIKEHVKNAIDFIHSNAVKYGGSIQFVELELSLIHISEPTRPY